MNELSRRVLSGLTTEQARAASATGPVLAISGAGTGKTTTLTAGAVLRLSEHDISPNRLLVVTFTNRAAAEMSARIRTLLGQSSIDAPNWMGTFHALGQRQMREFPDIAQLRPRFSMLDEADAETVVRRVMGDMNIDSRLARPSEVSSFIGKLKDCLVTPEDVENGFIIDPNDRRCILPSYIRTDNENLPGVVTDVYPMYQAMCQDSNWADFGDMLLWPILMMKRDEAFRTLWATRFDAVMADEYQDVNEAQYTWLNLLSRDHRNLFVVGDDAQAIFGWRGACVSHLHRFSKDYPEATTVMLEQNFRSTGHILNAANTIISRDRTTMEKRLFTTAGDGEKIQFQSFSSPKDEAAAVATAILRMVSNGASPTDICVIYRNNKMSVDIETALLRTGIKSVVVNGIAFFRRAEIRTAVSLLRLLTFVGERQSDVDFTRAVMQLASGVGEKSLNVVELHAVRNKMSMMDAARAVSLAPAARRAMDAFLARFAAAASRCAGQSLSETIRILCSDTGLWDKLAADNQGEGCANLEALFEQAGHCESLDEFLENAALGVDRALDVEAVTLTSMHGAKGLEWNTVFLVGWDDGIFPTARGNLNEERRLAYVALTRARRKLFISSSGWRYGDVTAVSKFIEEISAGDMVTISAPENRPQTRWQMPVNTEAGPRRMTYAERLLAGNTRASRGITAAR